ncbi:MAG TPA: YggT family protein [Candidatus Sulfomarinibacteraceae bacterium]|nr:YggT family protein [Candidatus Sulfomarinibacteraceae bacterium]
MAQSQEQPSEFVMTQREEDREQRLFSFKTSQLIWLAFGLVEALIAMRIVLKLIGANSANLFAAFIYDASYIFLFPFEGLVGTPTAGGAVLELSSIIAMIVYALLAWGVERIVRVVFYSPRW